jgi:hypothetical protein
MSAAHGQELPVPQTRLASRPSSEWNDDAFDVLAEKFDYRACWSFPVEAPSGKVVGTFAMYYWSALARLTRVSVMLFLSS